ncbi:hypothetical protein J6590_054615 [Homalodisca vitripennis]|nr:hypothetical protein J6590_054615 [Homalodisca vitripennis]
MGVIKRTSGRRSLEEVCLPAVSSRRLGEGRGHRGDPVSHPRPPRYGERQCRAHCHVFPSSGASLKMGSAPPMSCSLIGGPADQSEATFQARITLQTFISGERPVASDTRLPYRLSGDSLEDIRGRAHCEFRTQLFNKARESDGAAGGLYDGSVTQLKIAGDVAKPLTF